MTILVVQREGIHMTRTDTHRPSVINPDEYRFVSFHDHRPDAHMANIAENQAFRAHMEHTGGKFSDHSHGGSCHVCGAYAHTIARFYHVPTNTYVETGEICAGKLHDGDPLSFRSFRDKAKRGIAAATGKAKAQKFLTAAGLTAAWDVYENPTSVAWEETVVTDIVSKLVRYGSISEKQEKFLSSLLEKIQNRAEVEAARKAEADAAAPIPQFSGRTTVIGEVISKRWEDYGYHGGAMKALIKTVEGWKVWGTLPAAIDGVERGTKVQFDAKVTPSDDDPKFGFFKRPTKAALV